MSIEDDGFREEDMKVADVDDANEVIGTILMLLAILLGP